MGKGVIDWAAIPGNAAKILSSPRDFFEGMPKSGGFQEPFVFMIVMGFAAGVTQVLLKVFGLAPAVRTDVALSSVAVMPVTLAAFGFVGAAVLHLLWKMMGSGQPYEVSYRCVAYLAVLMPIFVVLETFSLPGAMASVVLGLFFLVAASVSAHGVPSWKAWLVFGSIGGLLVIRFARTAGW